MSPAWRSVFILSVLLALAYLDRIVISLLIDPIKADLGLTDTQIGVLTGFAFAITYAVCAIPFGLIVDKKSRRLVIAFGLTVWSICTAASALVVSYAQMLSARLGIGFGEASLNPSAISVISDEFPADRRALPISVFTTGLFVGGAVTYAVGGAIIEGLSGFLSAREIDYPVWRAVFLLLGGLGLPALLLLFIGVREPVRRHRVSKHTLGEVKRHLASNRRAFSSVFFGFPILVASAPAILIWLPATLLRVYQFSPLETGLYVGAIVGFGGIGGDLTGGYIVDHWVRKGRQDAPIVLGKYCCIGLILAGAGLLYAPSVLVYLVFSFIVMFLSTMPIGVQLQAVQAISLPAIRGTLASFYIAFVNLVGNTIGPLTVGIFTDRFFSHDTYVGKALALTVMVFPVISIILLSYGKIRYGRLANKVLLEERKGENG